jgi:cytochrome c2
VGALLGCGGTSGEAAGAASSAGGDPERGRALMAQYQCGACHRIPRVPGARGTLGPPLDRFGLRSYIAGELPNRPPALRAWIVDPPALVPGTTMPRLGVGEADARDMAAYLESLR